MYIKLRRTRSYCIHLSIASSFFLDLIARPQKLMTQSFPRSIFRRGLGPI